jgi:hypothetical protein
MLVDPTLLPSLLPHTVLHVDCDDLRGHIHGQTFCQTRQPNCMHPFLQVRLASLDKLRLKVDAARRNLDKKGRAALASITNTHATSTTATTTTTPLPHEPAATTAGSSKSNSSSDAAQSVPAVGGMSASGLSASWAEAAVGVAEGGAAGGLVETQQVLQHDLQREW